MHKYSRIRTLTDLSAKPVGPSPRKTKLWGRYCTIWRRRKEKKPTNQRSTCRRLSEIHWARVFRMLQPCYLGTFYVPPKCVKLPPPEVANKDLHADKMLEIREHWIMKLIAYAAKDGVICIFNVSNFNIENHHHKIKFLLAFIRCRSPRNRFFSREFEENFADMRRHGLYGFGGVTPTRWQVFFYTHFVTDFLDELLSDWSDGKLPRDCYDSRWAAFASKIFCFPQGWENLQKRSPYFGRGRQFKSSSTTATGVGGWGK